MAWSLLGALGIDWRCQPSDRIGVLCAWEGLVVNRSTWLLARAIWVSFAVVFLVFFGLELVFRVLDEAKLPHANYTAEEIGLVSISGMPRRLYLDLPLMVLIAVAAGLGGLAQSSELTILRAAGLSIQRIFFKIILVLSPILVGSIVIAQYGMPEAERFSQALKDANVSGGIKDSVWTRESGRYVFVEGAPDGSVRLWKQIEMADSRDEIERLIASSNVRFNADQVTLSKARVLAFESETIRQQTNDLTQTTKLTERQVRWLVQNPDALSLSELWDAASYLSAEGLNARAHSQLFWQRLLLPVTLIALALLASATAFGSMRSLGMSTRVFLAVLMGLVFKYAMDMASPAVFLAGGHPSLAIILPLLIPLLLTPRLLR
jgi:lipopolysaccharide export system permease protein